MTWVNAVLVAIGAGVGACGRYLTGHHLRERFSTTSAGSTLVVNVIGSFVLGLLAGPAIGGAWLALIGIGFCGALTTFSTLALDLWEALQQKRIRQALANVTVSLTLGLLAAYAGMALGG